ncbi:MAG: hypothetical protein K2O54_02860 [Prevotella sp.]|nr:hypothetical protein [Prevotella sp.]
MFFNEDGSLKINETIMNQPSFIKIMEDGKVTVEEIEEQSERVMALFHKIENTFTEEQKLLVRDLIVESNVLNTIFKQHGMQIALD